VQYRTAAILQLSCQSKIFVKKSAKKTLLGYNIMIYSALLKIDFELVIHNLGFKATIFIEPIKSKSVF
jgi:hypothetical protein